MKTNLSSGRRLLWRLFYCFAIVLIASALSRAADLQKTTIADVIYRADGSPATGTLVISWPAFTTADHAAVASGTLDVPIAPGGAVSLELAPNEGATPAGTYYKVVLKLDNEASSVEYWSVPKLSPTTIEKIRSTIVPAGVATQTVSRQYVDAAVAGVLHSAGAETVTGEKQFSVSPLVPTPAADLAAANKSYVDSHAGGAHVHSATDVVSGTRLGSRCLHTTSDGSQITEASADCGAGGASGDATSIRGKSVDPTAPSVGQSLVFNGTSYAPASDNSVDAIRDCGVKGDGVTDDGPAINACLAAHPGRRILLRATAAACTGGACAFRASYYSSATLMLAGNGQVLEGVAPALWNAPVGIKFAAGVPGIRIPSSCYGCAVRNLGLYGQAYWNRFDLTTYPAWTPATIIGNGPDGIQALGAYPDIENVDVEGFGRHGIFIDGGGSIENPSQPDGWKLDNIIVASNRGYGIFVYDGDANTGSARNINTRWNMLAGIYDRSYYGNVWTMPQSTFDGNIGAGAGATQAVSSISASGGTCTLTTSAALANGLGTTGTWVTIAGTSGGSAFDGTFKVDSVNSGARQLTYACASTGGPASGGTVGTASGTNIFAALTAQPGSPAIVHGAYVTGSGAAVWINPYCESTTASPDFGTGTVIGGNCGSTIVNTNWNYAQYTNNAGQANILSPGLTVTNHQDSANNLTFTSGVNADQWEVTRYVGHTGALQFYQGFIPGPEWVLYDVPNALGVIDYYSQTLHLRSAGANPVTVGYYGGSGGLDIYNGGTTRVAQITGAGQLVSNVATGTPPLSVASTTKVANFNADLLNGKHDTDFASAAHLHGAADTVSGARSGSRCLHTSADGTQIVEAASDCGSGSGADPTPALTEDASSVTSTKKLVAPEISTVGAGATVFHVTKGAKPAAETSGLANVYIDSTTNKLACTDGPSETDCMPSAALADASLTTKGAIQLAGDLGGSADAPSVPALANKQDTSAKNAANGYAGLDSSGLLAASQVPKPTPSARGGVYHASDCAAGQHVNGIDTATGQLKCSSDAGGATLVASGGSAGAGPSNQGTATTAARSDHDHRSIKTLTWFFPGTPATGAQPMVLVLPDSISAAALLDLRITVGTVSAGASAVNIERCYITGTSTACSATENTWVAIYSTALSLPASNYKANKNAAPDQNAANLIAGDRFRVNFATIGASLSDATVTLTYKANTTN